MHNEDAFLLIHETEGNSLFKEPRKYEVVASRGFIMIPSGYGVFHHIPVTDEGRPLFEYHYKNITSTIEKQTDFKAIRVLRPKKSDTYIIFSVWKNESAYKNWRKTSSFSEAHSLSPKIFLRPSFITKYHIFEEEEEQRAKR